jgi:hypothetical protein
MAELIVGHEKAYLEHCRKYSLTLPEEKPSSKNQRPE